MLGLCLRGMHEVLGVDAERATSVDILGTTVAESFLFNSREQGLSRGVVRPILPPRNILQRWTDTVCLEEMHRLGCFCPQVIF